MRNRGSFVSLTQSMTVGLSLMTLAGVAATGCSTSSLLHQHATAQSQGSVRLEEVADWEFEATHPSTIDIATLEGLLRGVVIAETLTDVSKLPVDGGKPMNVFSDEDVRYLAPLLAQALTQAQPEYVVTFRVSSSAGSGSAPTAGTLYVKDDRLFLTITEHDGSLEKIESSWFREGRPARIVTMNPESAGRVEQTLPSIAQGHSHLKSLAIDYTLFASNQDKSSAMVAAVQPSLAQGAPAAVKGTMIQVDSEMQQAKAVLPVSQSTIRQPNMPAPADQAERLNEALQEVQEVKQAMARKDAKIDALRKDLESMRVQLEMKDRELRTVKTKSLPPKPEKRRTAEITVR
ncbi:MAG: hypothetical protein UZ03_NOB001001907 [Nitrospira sp. OLB3]|nr:MAG: hypothetical protein UZ03_NOB001001907 [Nitrospira sp. OLB3]RIK58469.1 MAG: hypothetical protein DCC63_10835 [Nitrospira sp.]